VSGGDFGVEVDVMVVVVVVDKIGSGLCLGFS